MKHATRNILELRSLPQLSRAICMPGDNDPVRLPTYPALERTSVLAFNSTDTISVGPTAQPTVPLRGMLVKNSVTPCWLDTVGTSGYAWQMRWEALFLGGSATSIPTGCRFEQMPTELGGASGVTSLFTVTGALSPKAVPVGEYRDSAWLMVHKDCFLNIFISQANGSVVATGDAKMEFEVYYPGGDLTSNEIACVKIGGTPTPGWYGKYQMPRTGFVRPNAAHLIESSACVGYTTFVASNSVGYLNYSGAFTLSFDNVASRPVLLPAVVAPALSTSVIPFSNTRTPALSALFTNVTKALNKEGTVNAGRLNPAVVNIFDFNTDSFTNLLPSEKYFYGLENGFYTYSALSDSADHFRDEVFTATTSVVARPWLNLDDLSLVNCFVFTDPDGTTNLAMNVDWHVEYRNTSVLWPSAISSVSLETAHQLQLVLLQTGFFFENNTHRPWLKALTDSLSAMRPYVMPMLQGAVSALPGGSMAFNGIKGLIGGIKRGQRASGPKPTTLQVAARAPPSKPARGKKVLVAMPPRKKRNNGGKKKR